MGTIELVTCRTYPPRPLNHFYAEEITRVDLPEPGYWLLIGRVTVSNQDGDVQKASAQISRLVGTPTGTVLQPIVTDDLAEGIPGKSDHCFYLQAAVVTESEGETFSLLCGTYAGQADWGSLFALKVDKITLG